MAASGYESIILVDTSKPFSTIQLPWVGNVQGRVVTIKDIGGFAGVSNITIKTYMQPRYREDAVNVSYPQNTFDDGTTSYIIRNNFDYVVLYPHLNTWTIIGTNNASDIVATSILTSTVTANIIAASNIATSSMTANYIAASNITTSSINANYLGASTIAASSISANYIGGSVANLSTLLVSSFIASDSISSLQGTFSSVKTRSLTVDALNASSITIGGITVNSITSSGPATFTSLNTSVTVVSTLTVSSFVTSDSVSSLLGVFSSLNTGYLSASTIGVSSLIANYFSASTIGVSSLTANYLSASTIATSSMTANYFSASTIGVSSLTANYLSASTIATSSMTANYFSASSIATSSMTTNFLSVSTIATSTLIIQGGIASSGPSLLSTLTVSSLIQTKFISCSQGFFSSLGVNSNMPAFTLDVNGIIHATTDIILSSDSRLKENVVTIPAALEKVNNIRGVYYTLISSLTKDRKIGFIAQEIEQILPEVVHTEEEGEHMKSVSYGNVTALLIEGVKELTCTVHSLQRTLQTVTQHQESTTVGFQTLVDQQQSQITYMMSSMMSR